MASIVEVFSFSFSCLHARPEWQQDNPQPYQLSNVSHLHESQSFIGVARESSVLLACVMCAGEKVKIEGGQLNGFGFSVALVCARHDEIGSSLSIWDFERYISIWYLINQCAHKSCQLSTNRFEFGQSNYLSDFCCRPPLSFFRFHYGIANSKFAKVDLCHFEPSSASLELRFIFRHFVHLIGRSSFTAHHQMHQLIHGHRRANDKMHHIFCKLIPLRWQNCVYKLNAVCTVSFCSFI